jgi:hypothetical protein
VLLRRYGIYISQGQVFRKRILAIPRFGLYLLFDLLSVVRVFITQSPVFTSLGVHSSYHSCALGRTSLKASCRPATSAEIAHAVDCRFTSAAVCLLNLTAPAPLHTVL